MAVGPTLEMELRLAGLMARRADFAEGVRAVLVDKDQAPRWSPDRLDALDQAPDSRGGRGPAKRLKSGRSAHRVSTS